MTPQLDLIHEPPPPLLRPAPAFRRSDPETSQHAAEAARTLAGEQNDRILAALLRLPGSRGTYYEIADAAGLTPIQVARRLGHHTGLVGAGMVVRTDEVRSLPSRRPGHLYALAAADPVRG